MSESGNKVLRWLGAEQSDVAETQVLRMVVSHPDGHANFETLHTLGIRREHFANPHARVVFEAARRVHEEKRVVSLETVFAAAGAMDSKELCDWMLDLMDGDSPSSEYLDSVAAHLIDLRSQRRVKEIQSKIDEANESEATWEEKKCKLAELNHELSVLTKPAVERKQDPFEMIGEEFEARDKGEKPKDSKPIYTGMSEFDKWLRPIDLSTADYYTIIFGVSGNGKSSIGHQMFGESLRRGYRCAAFLGEVTADQMIKAMASQVARLDLLNYEMELKPRQDRFKRNLKGLKDLWQERMFIYDDNFVIEEIVRRCRSIAKNVGKLDMVLVDHLHQLKTLQKFPDERVRYNYMSSLFKPLAMELRCPVIVIAQPSRGLKSENRKPRVSDLKETGNLEDDADRIWGIYIPEKDSNGVEQFESLDPEGIIYQLKFKKGHQGSARVKFHKRFTLFEDWKQERQEEGRLL
ncbi:DnaB-like helicase C-terminal domain-containing protein [Pelagicoccus sp. SDUM812003]|uniref:DnaB-like helicase C-terminal domain-containing protein n=1 Tax=Pelagicoccus sp. SDUM812003 TaxID=3041267 RepID=UPI00280D975F|nr:DnaB-like helicase C-terminal domain-containing protein [Pelagicoccus sp. SDUM812003]MDQ8202785.1 DnaB-like helicase C-terminal domain-containing protein [Pelagicoccus sp. SDUM812003]